MSRQFDVRMPHHGEHQYDELDDDPKCAFQPARHPNACERPSSQHERYLTRALRPNYCVPSTASRSMILLTPRRHYLAGTPRLTAPFRVPSRYLAGAEPNVPAGFVLVPKAVYELRGAAAEDAAYTHNSAGHQRVEHRRSARARRPVCRCRRLCCMRSWRRRPGCRRRTRRPDSSARRTARWCPRRSRWRRACYSGLHRQTCAHCAHAWRCARIARGHYNFLNTSPRLQGASYCLTLP